MIGNSIQNIVDNITAIRNGDDTFFTTPVIIVATILLVLATGLFYVAWDNGKGKVWGILTIICLIAMIVSTIFALCTIPHKDNKIEEQIAVLEQSVLEELSSEYEVSSITFMYDSDTKVHHGNANTWTDRFTGETTIPAEALMIVGAEDELYTYELRLSEDDTVTLHDMTRSSDAPSVESLKK